MTFKLVWVEHRIFRDIDQLVSPCSERELEEISWNIYPNEVDYDVIDDTIVMDDDEQIEAHKVIFDRRVHSSTDILRIIYSTFKLISRAWVYKRINIYQEISSGFPSPATDRSKTTIPGLQFLPMTRIIKKGIIS